MPRDNVHELGLVSLLYVSRSSIEESQGQKQLEDIITVAVARNARSGVTGALLYTGAHFAQVLEGPRKAVSELMHSIERDNRHRDVTTVRSDHLRQRLFADWAMAYSGRSPYLDRHVKPLLSSVANEEQKGELIASLMDVLSSVRRQL